LQEIERQIRQFVTGKVLFGRRLSALSRSIRLRRRTWLGSACHLAEQRLEAAAHDRFLLAHGGG
jgi:hypothetical protein